MNNPFQNNKFLETVREVASLGTLLWEKGWAERNAGNISVNISEHFEGFEDSANRFDPAALPKSHVLLGGQSFLITGTGKRMRELSIDPANNLMVIRLGTAGDHYRVFSLNGEHIGFGPSSELPTHLSIHEQLISSGSKDKAIVHTHPNELIALTQIRQFCNEENLNKLLWGMHPETMVFIPEGAGFIPYMLPGSNEIAEATLEKFRKHKAVIWEKHGCFAIGKDIFEAFDIIDTLAKSARIYFDCRSAGHEPEGLTPEQLIALKELSRKFAT